MRKKGFKTVVLILILMGLPAILIAEDRVMVATKGREVEYVAPDSLSLSLVEAQEYAVRQNRSLKNASLAVQEAYAARWQTIAAMLPQVNSQLSYSNSLGYVAEMSTAMGKTKINMPNALQFTVTASIGLSAQSIVGTLLNNVAIDMKKIALEQSETQLRGSVMTSYVSLLALQSITDLLDSSLNNICELEQMTQKAVEAGAAEQVTADQIRVRVNTLKNSINAQKRSIELAFNSLKVLLDIPAETKLILTENMDAILSPQTVITLLSENFNIHKNLNYQILEKNTELAKRNLHMAGWAYGPTISLAYNYTDQHYYGDGGFRMTPPNLIQVGVSFPLWSSGKRAAGVVEKKIAYEEAKNTLSEKEDQLTIQYHQLCYNLNSSYETYETEKDNIEVSKRVFTSVTNKYKLGAASMLELTNASNDLIMAQQSYVNAMLSLVQAQVSLEIFLNN